MMRSGTPDDTVTRLLQIRFGLTAREAEVALHLAEGLRYSDIAGELGVSYHTVSSHVKAVLSKTGCKTSRRVAALVHSLAARSRRRR